MSCHHGMARPQVADGGDGHPANILNKLSRTAEKAWSCSLRVGINNSPKENNFLQNVTKVRVQSREQKKKTPWLESASKLYRSSRL
jgi:hypothetical protein